MSVELARYSKNNNFLVSVWRLVFTAALTVALAACGGGGGGSDSGSENSGNNIVPTASAVTLSWVPPTNYTDGTPLGADLAGYRIRYVEEQGVYPHVIDIPNPGIGTYIVEGLSPGTYYFAATAYTYSGGESNFSDLAVVTLR